MKTMTMHDMVKRHGFRAVVMVVAAIATVIQTDPVFTAATDVVIREAVRQLAAGRLLTPEQLSAFRSTCATEAFRCLDRIEGFVNANTDPNAADTRALAWLTILGKLGELCEVLRYEELVLRVEDLQVRLEIFQRPIVVTPEEPADEWNGEFAGKARDAEGRAAAFAFSGAMYVIGEPTTTRTPDIPEAILEGFTASELDAWKARSFESFLAAAARRILSGKPFGRAYVALENYRHHLVDRRLIGHSLPVRLLADHELRAIAAMDQGASS